MNKYVVMVGLLLSVGFSAKASMVEIRFQEKKTPIHRQFNPSTPTNDGKELLKQAKLSREEYSRKKEESRMRQKEKELMQKEKQLRQEGLYIDLIDAVNAVDEANVPKIIELIDNPALQNRELVRCFKDIYSAVIRRESAVDIKICVSLLGRVPNDNIIATARKIHIFAHQASAQKQ